jgi:putative phosphoribosyl transferase
MALAASRNMPRKLPPVHPAPPGDLERDPMVHAATLVDIPIAVHADHAVLHGDLTVPDGAVGLIVFANGCGSSRRSSRNRSMARGLHEAGFATLLMDLLTEPEEARNIRMHDLRFDIDMMAGRVTAAVQWAATSPFIAALPVGLLAASTGAAAALKAAARLPETIRAIVSRGGRADLAGASLPLVKAPTLLLVGGADEDVLDLNRQAYEALRCERRLTVVPGVSHRFEEPGALDLVTRLASAWFGDHLRPPDQREREPAGAV